MFSLQLSSHIKHYQLSLHASELCSIMYFPRGCLLFGFYFICVYVFQRRSVNVKKLMKPDINRKYQEESSYKLALLPNKLNSAEKEWIDFKDIIQGTAEKMVGQKKCGGQQKKATAWWNEETYKLRN